MGTIVKLLVACVLFATFGLFVAFMCVLIDGSWAAIRRQIIIFVFGYCGDVAEWISAVTSSIAAGFRSLFKLDEEVREALDC